MLFALGQVLLSQMFRLAPLLLTWLAVSGLAKGVEPTADKSDLLRVSPTSPKNVINTFSIREGFEIQLVAAEPLVVDPVAMVVEPAEQVMHWLAWVMPVVTEYVPLRQPVQMAEPVIDSV